MIRHFINRINLIGVSDKTDKDQIHYISFTNVLIIINGLAIWFYISYLFLYLPDSKILFITATLQFVIYTVALVCNHLQWYFLSRNILCFTALIFTTVEAVITNFYCDIHFFLLIGVIFAFFVFPGRERKYSYFISLCFAVSFLAIEIHLSYNGSYPQPPDYVMNLKHIIRSCLLILIFFFAYYSYTTIDKFHSEMKSESIRIEATSKNDKKLFFENAGMYQILADSQELACGDFIKNIYKNLIQFSGSENFDDDICMICIDIV